ncbi:MAG: ABC transporter ATP-binding protein/permease [Clostridiales bacterium]|nr:ABC transporter ATP-binding protein/permease [Clostridiales bacterium]
MKKHEFRPNSIDAYFRAEWLPLTFVTLSGLVYNIGLLAGPWYEGKMAQCLADILQGNEAAGAMAALVAAYVLVTMLVQSARFVKRFYVRRFANNINRRMKGVLYANLVRQSRSALGKEGSGELMTKAISDVDDCAEGMRKFTTEFFDTGVALVGYVVMLLVYDWRLALMCMIFPPVSYICAQKMKKLVQRSGAAYKKAASGLRAATLDRAKNAVTYRVYGCEKAQEGRYEDALDNYEQTAVRANVWQSALPPLYLAVSNLSVIFILYFGGKNVLGNGWRAWDIAAFTTFLSCFVKMATKSSKTAKLFHSVQRAEVSWKRMKPLMKAPEALPPLNVPDGEPLEVKGVSFAYPGCEPTFQNLTFSAKPGDIIGITGPVACGKSTLGRMFLCEEPYSGSIRLGNRELSGLTAREISERIGYLGHDPELWNDTIKANVLCGETADPMAALSLTAMDKEVRSMEQGVNTIVGSSGVRLSGGQAQRLALARALAHPRPVLILDDPFSALDRPTEDAVFADLKAYAKDKIVLLISHRLYHFPEMKEILFLEDGTVTAGTHEALLSSNAAYRNLYEGQTGGEDHA